ncbi:diacylglycerol/lipid kinase family protein [Nitratireductor luteus]|uniref:diacylglycerol/lipid kinase family protein n=1 Tax=Nitratireductor luteus TaxID=2976980 RepID=UPI00224024E7|nr:diacylglycerol kinase family protein [Nitratireductor luteus]
MKILAVLNRSGGTLATMDIDAFSASLAERFKKAGHEIDVRVVPGKEIADAIGDAAGDADIEAVLVGGGDGTVSLAAGMLAESEKALAILPAGTMNLFARSLGIPLDLNKAVEALAHGRIRRVDVARVNGAPFVHQLSIGMHPQLIRLRSRLSFRGRLGKIAASARAALTTFLRPHNLRVRIEMAEGELHLTTSGIAVTNNLYGEGHLPYTDTPDGGLLGLYVMRAQRRWDLLVFFANMAIGRWRRNEQVDIHQTREARIFILDPHPRHKLSMDGELYPLPDQLHLRQHPKALSVLVPTA